MPETYESTDDRRAVENNTMRHQYRVLTEEEKGRVGMVKLKSEELLNYLAALPPSREMSLAKTKVEEAVMWAVKGITA